MTDTKICNRKKCSHGGEPQPVSNFGKMQHTEDGLNKSCKDCIKEPSRHKKEVPEGFFSWENEVFKDDIMFAKMNW